MRKREIVADILIFLLIVLAIGGIIFVSLKAPSLDEEKEISRDGLPVLEFSLKNTTLEEMKNGDKLTKYGGNELVVKNKDEEYIFQDVELRGRGNSTWVQEKKPWQIRFVERTELLGIGKVKKWVLLANVFDASFLRNYIAFEILKMMDAEFTNDGKMVEVEFDGEYEGLFYLTPKIEIDKGSVDLRDELGALVELDNLRVDSEYYLTYAKNRLFLKDAVSSKSEETTKKAMGEFLSDFNRLEIAAEARNFSGVSAVIDVTSFAEAYLIKEFTVDPDAYTASFYMYKDGPNDKIHAGPMWDFDLGFGNYAWDMPDRHPNFYSPTETMVNKDYVFNKLIYRMMEIPEFREEVNRIFREKLSGRSEELLEKAKKMSEEIVDAIKKDAEKWEYDDYEEETEYVLNWVEKRYEYFEKVYGNL